MHFVKYTFVLDFAQVLFMDALVVVSSHIDVWFGAFLALRFAYMVLKVWRL